MEVFATLGDGLSFRTAETRRLSVLSDLGGPSVRPAEAAGGAAPVADGLVGRVTAFVALSVLGEVGSFWMLFVSGTFDVSFFSGRLGLDSTGDFFSRSTRALFAESMTARILAGPPLIPLTDAAGCVMFTLAECGDWGLMGDFSADFGAICFVAGTFTGAVFDVSVEDLGFVVLVGDFAFDAAEATFS